LATYRARIKPAINIKLENHYTAYGVPPPASSAITLLILKVMDGEWEKINCKKKKDLVWNLGYGLTPQSLDTDEKQVRFYHILNEVFKFAYGKRSALGDEYDSQTDKNHEIEKVQHFLFLDEINSNIEFSSFTSFSLLNMRKKFVNELMKRKLNHWIIMNRCLNLRQVLIYSKWQKILTFFILKIMELVMFQSLMQREMQSPLRVQ
jgi:gamma-glutamyltranspeptidase